jgi:hypothetical protein
MTSRRRPRPLLLLALLCSAVPAVLACQAAPDAVPERAAAPAAEDRELFMSAARTAWRYVDGEYSAETGLVNSVAGYPFATIWDVGSGLLAMFAAERLGLLEGEEYDRRMRRALATLAEMRLYDGAAFNKNYHVRTGRIAGRAGNEDDPAQRGYGWSALDLGRFLAALKVIERNQPQYAGEVRAVVERLDFGRLVGGGYLRGEDLSPATGRPRAYQEGRIGYEQYAATGFAAWGHRAERALDLMANARPMTVLGVPLLADSRGGEHLTSDPLVMLGLEFGWTPETRGLAWRVLAAQEARWRETGRVTIVNEDALTGAPYFLYYSVIGDGRPFLVEPPAGAPPGPTPRTVSTKGAYAWHALLPSAYTRRAVQTVEAARQDGGWAAGVMEDDPSRPSGAPNINTAAVVLQAALYVVRGGRPLVDAP